MHKKIFKIPKRCPLIKTCKDRVLQEIFEGICNTEDWVICEYAQKEAKKYKLSPKEWYLILNLKKSGRKDK